MSLKGIIAIAGVPGLHKVLAQARNGFIVESLSDKKRFSISSSQRISALQDISVYTLEEDIPLRVVFKSLKDQNVGPDAKNLAPDKLRAHFETILPNFDQERVYTSDIKKIYTWFGLLKDISNFEEESEDNSSNEADSQTEVAAEDNTAKDTKKKTAGAKAEKAPKEKAEPSQSIAAAAADTKKKTPAKAAPKAKASEKETEAPAEEKKKAAPKKKKEA